VPKQGVSAKTMAVVGDPRWVRFAVDALVGIEVVVTTEGIGEVL